MSGWEALGKNPVVYKTRIEQLELKFLMALGALSMLPDSNDESEENVAPPDSLPLNGANNYEELQSRYRLAREDYKTELWNRDFEPVLQRIRAAAAAITNADLENAKSEAVSRLMASVSVVQKEKDVLDGLLGECVWMGDILGDVGWKGE